MIVFKVANGVMIEQYSGVSIIGTEIIQIVFIPNLFFENLEEHIEAALGAQLFLENTVSLGINHGTGIRTKPNIIVEWSIGILIMHRFTIPMKDLFHFRLFNTILETIRFQQWMTEQRSHLPYGNLIHKDLGIVQWSPEE